jgi:ParB-like chromosome segregation protein Spo0J
MKLSKLKGNPNNPRIIKDDKFKKLVKSINDFPKMMALRPIVVDENFIIQGGNMRLKALQEIGFKDIPDEWVKQVKDLNEDEKKQFIIKDNVGFGEWDWDDLANNWDAEQLTEWGLDIPNFAIEPSLDELIGEEKNKPATLKITFESVEQLQEAEIDIKELIDRKYKNAYYSVSAGEI